MKVEHITLWGNSVIRDTDDIGNEMKAYFQAVKVAYKSAYLEIPEIPGGMRIKVMAAKEGAAFDLMYGDDIVVVNFCCFGKEFRGAIMEQVEKISKVIPFPRKPQAPAMDVFLYSALINPFVAPEEWLMIAGEIELYVFERLYSAWVEARN